VSILAAAILAMLRWLWTTSDPREEQLAIGLGAKMGNGLLACTLTWLVLEAEGAPQAIRLAALAFVAVVYGSVFLLLSARRDEIRIAYKA
jgi:hypothetical protein